MTRLMSQKDYAAHRGVGKSAVSNWKKEGLLVFAEDTQSGRLMVDVARTDARINARKDPFRGRPIGGSAAAAAPAEDAGEPEPVIALASPSLADARLDLIVEQKTGAALKNAREAGELVPLIEYERRSAEIGRLIRERVQSAFRGLAERLAAERDPRVIMAIGEEEFDRVFSALADDAEGDLFDADGETEEDEDNAPPAPGGQTGGA